MVDVVIELCFDNAAETGDFSITIDGSLVTSYNFVNTPDPEVSITAFTSPMAISTEDLIALVSDINVFSNQLRIRFQPIETPTSKYTIDLEKNTSSIEARMNVEGVLLTDVKWDSDTDIATFEPRGASTLTWSDYLGWQEFLKNVLSEIQRF